MNIYAPRMVNPSLHKKQVSLSDYLFAERKFWGKVAIVAGLALCVVAWGFVALLETETLTWSAPVVTETPVNLEQALLSGGLTWHGVLEVNE